jgi:DNA polymerase-3 subunit alpha
VVKGRLKKREEVPRLMAMEVSVLDVGPGPAGAERGPLVINLPVPKATRPLVEELKGILATHPGTTGVHIRLGHGAKTTVLRVDDAYRVSPSPALLADIKQLLGSSAVQ